MSETKPTCAKCGGPMAAGFLLDQAHGQTFPGRWVRGQPIKSFWTGIKLRGQEILEVTTYRCGRCGYLESYARDRVE